MYNEQQRKIIMTDQEKENIKDIFTDPVKILILFKIMKKPGISSKELKEDLNIKGTKIYYYLSVFEGLHPKTKEKISKPVVRIETEETVNHLIMKKYYVNDYFKGILESQGIIDLYEDPLENLKWNYMFGLNIGIALLKKHLRDVERAPLEEFKEGAEFRKLISFNNIAFVKKEVYENNKDLMKKLFDSICSDNETGSLLDSLLTSTHAFVFGATDW